MFAEKKTFITIYYLPTKKNKLFFSHVQFAEKTEVCCFHFPFGANKGVRNGRVS
jgi:hypothetical protein